MSRKVKISFLVLIWGIVGIQSCINWKISNRENVVEAFSYVKDEKEEINVKGYAYLGTDSLSEIQKETILHKLAKELGYKTDNHIVESQKNNYRQWSLTTDEPDTLLQVISLTEGDSETRQISNINTDREENYLFIETTVNEGWESGKKLYDKINHIFDEMGINGNVNLEKTYVQEGNLQKNKKEREEFIKYIFEEEGAEIVDEMDVAGFYTVYGYRNNEKSISNAAGKKVNIQIVFSYSKNDQVTYIKVGCPIVNSIY